MTIVAYACVSRSGSPPEARLVTARLDDSSGLFLVAGEGQGQWVLEARTWGHPDPESVHRWKVKTATAARQLGYVPTHSLPAALEIARGSGAQRIGYLLSPPYFPLVVGG